MSPEFDARIAALQSGLAALRRDMKTAFHRIDEQTKLTDTVHKLALSMRDLANMQESTKQTVAGIRRDVDELKSRPGRRWEMIVTEIMKYCALALMGYLLAKWM